MNYKEIVEFFFPLYIIQSVIRDLSIYYIIIKAHSIYDTQSFKQRDLAIDHKVNNQDYYTLFRIFLPIIPLYILFAYNIILVDETKHGDKDLIPS